MICAVISIGLMCAGGAATVALIFRNDKLIPWENRILTGMADRVAALREWLEAKQGGAHDARP